MSFHLVSAHRTAPEQGCGIAEPLPIRSPSTPCPGPGSMAPGAVKPPKPARGPLISALYSSGSNRAKLSQGGKGFFPPESPLLDIAMICLPLPGAASASRRAPATTSFLGVCQEEGICCWLAACVVVLFNRFIGCKDREMH